MMIKRDLNIDETDMNIDNKDNVILETYIKQ